MFQLFLIVAGLIGIAFIGLSIGLLIKGRFPQTHIGQNSNMKKMGITCAKNESALCQGRQQQGGCDGCSCLR